MSSGVELEDPVVQTAKTSPAAALLRRFDGRFLLPPPPGGAFAHLVLLGGPAGLAEVVEEAGIARRVSTSLPEGPSADALAVFHGSKVPPEEAVRCLAPGGCAWIELESWRRIPRGSRLRVTGVYAVHPGFDRHEAYIPLDHPAALRWYAETLQPAWTWAKWLRREGVRALSWRGGALLTRSFALTAVVPASASSRESSPQPLSLWEREPEGEDSRAERSESSRARGLRPLLLAHGLERAVILPFAPGETEPRGVLKVPRLPLFNAKTETEQSLLAHIRGRLGPAARSALPEPRGIYRAGNLSLGLESYAAGRPLVQRDGSWGEPLASKMRDLRDAAGWLIEFHRQTEVRRTDWDAVQRAEWIGLPLGALRQASSAAVVPERLLASVRHRSDTLDGAAFPIVWQHRDFTPWNVLRGDGGLRVIDWEGARPGPALSDLLHFSTHWSELAHQASDEAARLRVFREVWIARRGGEPGEAVRRAVASYCEQLRLDRRFVPLLLVAAWAELALRRGGEAPNPEAAYVATLAESAEELFGGWCETGWR
jgi:hypothetical protein